VGVSEGVNVSVDGRVGVGSRVCEAANVKVLVMVGIGLMKNTLAARFI
jgi:hypothetical protein